MTAARAERGQSDNSCESSQFGKNARFRPSVGVHQVGLLPLRQGLASGGRVPLVARAG